MSTVALSACSCTVGGNGEECSEPTRMPMSRNWSSVTCSSCRKLRFDVNWNVGLAEVRSSDVMSLSTPG